MKIVTTGPWITHAYVINCALVVAGAFIAPIAIMFFGGLFLCGAGGPEEWGQPQLFGTIICGMSALFIAIMTTVGAILALRALLKRHTMTFALATLSALLLIGAWILYQWMEPPQQLFEVILSGVSALFIAAMVTVGAILPFRALLKRNTMAFVLVILLVLLVITGAWMLYQWREPTPPPSPYVPNDHGISAVIY